MPTIAHAHPNQLSGTTEEGFVTLYGVPAAMLGEDGDRLMALGHITDRTVLAVTNAYHRRAWGQRLLPDRKLADLLTIGTTRIVIKVSRTGERDDCAWHFDTADPSDPEAQPVTIINVEWPATAEDIAVQSECPACGRASRATTRSTGPGRAGSGRYHRCRYCDHTWPAAPAYRPSLTKRRRFKLARPDGCFACDCVPEYPCTAGCAIWRNPVIGQHLCFTCREQFTDDVWKQLAAAAYGTATTYDDLDAQRDRWLYSEALRGTPPAQAAQTWQHRLALAARRATPRSQPTAA